jgi:hypothetical protein
LISDVWQLTFQLRQPRVCIRMDADPVVREEKLKSRILVGHAPTHVLPHRQELQCALDQRALNTGDAQTVRFDLNIGDRVCGVGGALSER